MKMSRSLPAFLIRKIKSITKKNGDVSSITGGSTIGLLIYQVQSGRAGHDVLQMATPELGPDRL